MPGIPDLGVGMQSNLPLELIFVAGLFLAFSGVPGLFMNRQSSLGQLVATLLAVFGGVLGLLGTGLVLVRGVGKAVVLNWPIPDSSLALNVDALSAFFLIPVFLVSGLGSIYGMSYWKAANHPSNGQKLRFFYGLLPASMTLLLAARNSIHFLIGWEVMALSTFFLVTTEDEDLEVRKAGWLYFIATRVGTLALFAMFALLRKATGSFALRPLVESEISLGSMTLVFLLAIVGFGTKAGIMPLHVWLPSAHGKSPTHVSAFLSGVIIKIGIYGLLRVFTLLPNPPASWGGLLLILGVISGVFGVVFAIGQHDLKRLLAYHSIENIGIIVMGLGLAMLGKSLGRMDWIVLGLGGCLLHVWNHCLFKSLLFFSAGSIIHATNNREIDRMGGLARSMPYTAMLFLIGAVAICGLPPLNGFVSELLIYLGLFNTIGIGEGRSWTIAVLAAPFLAVIGALAVACFVKVYGTMFLGEPRSRFPTTPHESPPGMILPMGVLAICCATIGLVPTVLIPILERAITVWSLGAVSPGQYFVSFAPLSWISIMAVTLVTVAAISYGLLQRRIRGRVSDTVSTWSCGYAAVTPRMQYTGTSIVQMLVGFFSWALRPQIHQPDVRGFFPRTGHFKSHVGDSVLDNAVFPFFHAGERFLAWFRTIHQGLVQQHIIYILVTVLLLLLWLAPLEGIMEKVLSR